MMPTLLPASEEAVGASIKKFRSPSVPFQPAGATRFNVGLNVTEEIELGDADGLGDAAGLGDAVGFGPPTLGPDEGQNR
jgi:hypothetical protein